MADLASFRAYALARGDSAPTAATDADAEAALVRAGDYIAAEYVARFIPAFVDPLPDAVEAATYEAARLELVTVGVFSKTYSDAGDKVLTGVGDIRWEFTGRKGGSQVPKSTRIDGMMRPFIGGNTKTLLRS